MSIDNSSVVVLPPSDAPVASAPYRFINEGLRNTSGADRDADLIATFLAERSHEGTRRVYELALAKLVNWIRGGELRNLTMVEAFKWKHDLQRTLKPATVRSYVGVASAFFSFGATCGYFLNNPFKVRARSRRPELPNRRLEGDDIAALIRNAPSARYRMLFEFLYVSGARIAEALRLTWGDITEDGGEAIVRLVGKFSKVRTVTLNRSFTRKLLATRGEATETDRLWTMSDVAVRQAVTKAAQRSGITKPVSPHWFRHAHASHALDMGENVHVVQKTLGHDSLDTTTRYAKPSKKDSSSRMFDRFSKEIT